MRHGELHPRKVSDFNYGHVHRYALTNNESIYSGSPYKYYNIIIYSVQYTEGDLTFNTGGIGLGKRGFFLDFDLLGHLLITNVN